MLRLSGLEFIATYNEVRTTLQISRALYPEQFTIPFRNYLFESIVYKKERPNGECCNEIQPVAVPVVLIFSLDKARKEQIRKRIINTLRLRVPQNPNMP
jgi:hypothetical protein